MQINKKGLHSIFDQYCNEENRLTHALLHTIGSSSWLFISFLKNIVGINASIPGNKIYEISTQKVPFSHGDNDPQKVESIPDAWIVEEGSKLGVAIEVKDQRMLFDWISCESMLTE